VVLVQVVRADETLADLEGDLLHVMETLRVE
jgi:hypothetical protein